MVINTLQYDARYTQRHINILQYDARYTPHINTLQYDARYTQRHINTLQYDARYTQRQIKEHFNYGCTSAEDYRELITCFTFLL